MKWRVISWHADKPITIEWRDGNVEECLDCIGADDWQVSMTIEAGDDCEAAGWVLDDDEQYFDPGGKSVDPPTRWHDERELPDWWGGDE